jgi:carotenoid phi-ring synthase / carotenoid chi-ring synthase
VHQDSSAPVVVVGCGPAGLAAALTLARGGIRVWLVERADALGGKVRSVSDPTHRYEHGMHGWWPGYRNFDRLLSWADVDVASIMRPAADISVLVEDGRHVHIRPLPNYVPSPLFMLVQALRTPLLTFSEVLRLGRFFIHLLAFDPVRDAADYSHWSFDRFLDYVGVTKRTKNVFFEAYIKAFCYSRLDEVSAAVALASFQHYVVPGDREAVPRWLTGFGQDVMFAALEKSLVELGVEIFKNATVTAVVHGDHDHLAVAIHGIAPPEEESVSPLRPLAPTLLGTVSDSAITPDGTSLTLAGEPIFVRRTSAGLVEAMSRRCTHAGCTVEWSQASTQFLCPCHGGVFDRDGRPRSGPSTKPLVRLAASAAAGGVEISSRGDGVSVNCSAVVLATDAAAALEIVSKMPGVGLKVRHDIGHLATTSVIVIRFWFDAAIPLDGKPESALTPLLPMIDAYFCVSRIVPSEGGGRFHVVEAQIASARSHYLALGDEAMVSLALEDLSQISADYTRAQLRHYRIQRHVDVFTSFPPGIETLSVPAEIAPRVYAAADWAPRPGNSWMMERAVAAGVARAGDILKSRAVDDVPEVLDLPKPGWMLRLVSLLAFLVRALVGRGFQLPPQLTVKQMMEHDRLDHVINGWACLVIAFCAMLPLFDPGFAVLSLVWPIVFVVINVYFFLHVEPWVRVTHGSWLRSLADKHTLQHRMMTGGGIVAGAIEAGLAFDVLSHVLWTAVFPIGSMVFGVLFTLHHWGEEPLADRQHRDIGFVAILGGACLGLARFFPLTQPLIYAWPILVLYQAYLFISYMSTTLHGHAVQPETDGHTGHTH